MTLEELCGCYDWAEVFADESSGNTTKDVEAVGDCPIDPAPWRKDVTEIIAIRNGQPDGDDWVGVFRLDDGRFLLAYGGCDYTGWD